MPSMTPIWLSTSGRMSPDHAADMHVTKRAADFVTAPAAEEAHSPLKLNEKLLPSSLGTYAVKHREDVGFALA